MAWLRLFEQGGGEYLKIKVVKFWSALIFLSILHSPFSFTKILNFFRIQHQMF
jgi:hypothetical protein